MFSWRKTNEAVDVNELEADDRVEIEVKENKATSKNPIFMLNRSSAKDNLRFNFRCMSSGVRPSVFVFVIDFRPFNMCRCLYVSPLTAVCFDTSSKSVPSGELSK